MHYLNIIQIYNKAFGIRKIYLAKKANKKIFLSTLIQGDIKRDKIKNYFTNNPFSCYIVSIGGKYIQVDKLNRVQLYTSSQAPILELFYLKIHIFNPNGGGGEGLIVLALFLGGYFFMKKGFWRFKICDFS